MLKLQNYREMLLTFSHRLLMSVLLVKPVYCIHYSALAVKNPVSLSSHIFHR